MFRPEIKLDATPSDKIMISWSVYLAVVLVMINGLEWFLNKDMVEPFLTKYKMLFLSLFGILIAFGGNYLSKYPQHFNYRVEITEENAKQQYSKTVRALRWMIIIILTVLSGVSINNLFQRIGHLPLAQHISYFPIIIVVCYLFYGFIYFKAKRSEPKA